MEIPPIRANYLCFQVTIRLSPSCKSLFMAPRLSSDNLTYRKTTAGCGSGIPLPM